MPTRAELVTALERAHAEALVRGSAWQSLPGAVRLPWLEHAHQLARVLARARPDKPLRRRE